MKKLITLLFLCLLGLAPLSAKSRIQVNGEAFAGSLWLYNEPEELAEWISYLPNCFEGVIASYCYEFTPENNFRWLLGCDFGINRLHIGGFHLIGGFIVSTVKKDNFAMDTQFMLKIGNYHQLAMDFVFSNNKPNCFFYGLGVHASYSGSVMRDSDGTLDYKMFITPGMKVFVGYRF